MAATREEVRQWIIDAKKAGATHVISVCDTFDSSDYPVQVMPGENVEEIKKQYDDVRMQSINEVFDLNDDIEKMLDRKIEIKIPPPTFDFQASRN